MRACRAERTVARHQGTVEAPIESELSENIESAPTRTRTTRDPGSLFARAYRVKRTIVSLAINLGSTMNYRLGINAGHSPTRGPSPHSQSPSEHSFSSASPSNHSLPDYPRRRKPPVAMTKAVRPRRHSLTNPLALGGQQPFGPAKPFMDLRSPHLCRPKPPSPVDSVLKPDLRFPQGDAEAGVRLAEACADEGKRRRGRSKSVGARPSPDASPSLEDVKELLALTDELNLPWPVAPAPSLVDAYGGMCEGLEVLRRRCLYFDGLARKGNGGDGVGQAVRGLARAGTAAEMALLPIVFPPSRNLGPDDGDKAADVLTPAVARQLAARVHTAAAVIDQARYSLGGWRDRYDTLCDWQDQIETAPPDANYLPRGVARSTLLAEVERDKERAVNKLVDRLLPGHTHAVHTRARGVCEFLRGQGLYHEIEPIMTAAWPEPVPGEQFEGLPRDMVDPLQPHEPEILCEEFAYESSESESCTIRTATVAPSETESATARNAVPGPATDGDGDGDGDASRYPGTASLRHRIRWAYLRLRFRSRGRQRRVDHQAALDAFGDFQGKLNASLAVAEEEPSRNAATKRLLAKVVVRVEWHDWHLNGTSPPPPPPPPLPPLPLPLPPSVLSREEEDDEKTAVPSTVGVFFSDDDNDKDDDDDGWATQLSESLLRVGSSNRPRPDKETGEHKSEDGRGHSSSSSSINSRDYSPRQVPRINSVQRTGELTQCRRRTSNESTKGNGQNGE